MNREPSRRIPAILFEFFDVRPTSFLLALGVGAWLGCTPLDAQEPVHGPFRVVEQNPIYRLFHTPQSDGADLLRAGTVRIDAGAGYGNVLEISQGEAHAHLLDLERLTTDLEVRWAPGDGWEVGAGLRTITDWGGFLDAFISDFHHFFGFPDGNRGQVEDDRYAFRLVQQDRGVELELPQRGLALDDVRVFAKRRIHRSADGSRALSARGVVNLAAGPPEVERARADLAVELLGRQSLGRWHLHGAVGVTSLNAPRALEAVSRDGALYLTAGGERLLTDRLSLVAQFVGGTGYLQGVGDDEVDGHPMNLVFGLAGGGTGPWGWQLSFSEDVPPGSPSTDFTLALRVARTL